MGFFSERIGHKSTKIQIMTELKASKTFLRNHRFESVKDVIHWKLCNFSLEFRLIIIGLLLKTFMWKKEKQI